MPRRRGTLGALAVFALASAASGAVVPLAAGDTRPTQTASIVDIEGRTQDPFRPSDRVNVIFFVATDCPISNAYAPEIQRICRDYRSRGVSCLLAYEDLDTTSSSRSLDSAVRDHLREYRYTDIPVVVDRSRLVARLAKASITPQAVVIDREGQIRYRGRIDNWYATFGTRRRTATEHDLRDALDAVIERRPVRMIETEALGCYIADPPSPRK